MADAGNKWYVLKAVSGKEAKVKEYIEAEMKHNDLLAANVSQVLIPVEKHATVRNGKRVVKEKVSLPGYVFVEAEAHGLGICYLGTTIYTAEEIARILDLPKGVIPVTTIVVGHPDESPELTDRLPLDAVVHCEKYHHYTSSEIDELWAEKETSEETRRLLEENGLPNLAQIFTRNRYRAEDNLAISRNYFALLKKQGFFNN